MNIHSRINELEQQVADLVRRVAELESRLDDGAELVRDYGSPFVGSPWPDRSLHVVAPEPDAGAGAVPKIAGHFAFLGKPDFAGFTVREPGQTVFAGEGYTVSNPRVHDAAGELFETNQTLSVAAGDDLRMTMKDGKPFMFIQPPERPPGAIARAWRWIAALFTRRRGVAVFGGELEHYRPRESDAAGLFGIER